jgi:hypothetical protein
MEHLSASASDCHAQRAMQRGVSLSTRGPAGREGVVVRSPSDPCISCSPLSILSPFPPPCRPDLAPTEEGFGTIQDIILTGCVPTRREIRKLLHRMIKKQRFEGKFGNCLPKKMQGHGPRHKFCTRKLWRFENRFRMTGYVPCLRVRIRNPD